ncbi:MAG: hypothetical protein IJ262_10850 [Clostridia bacterium]|nr:hypothetical protein [Clostridia bacterium]MBQ8029888.1 hypothetical protein [Clostridia bacterium]
MKKILVLIAAGLLLVSVLFLTGCSETLDNGVSDVSQGASEMVSDVSDGVSDAVSDVSNGLSEAMSDVSDAFDVEGESTVASGNEEATSEEVTGETQINAAQ